MDALTKPISVRLPAALAEWLKKEAQRQMLTQSDIIRRAIARDSGLLEKGADDER